jgi:hypothetical protein
MLGRRLVAHTAGSSTPAVRTRASGRAAPRRACGYCEQTASGRVKRSASVVSPWVWRLTRPVAARLWGSDDRLTPVCPARLGHPRPGSAVAVARWRSFGRTSTTFVSQERTFVMIGGPGTRHEPSRFRPPCRYLGRPPAAGTSGEAGTSVRPQRNRGTRGPLRDRPPRRLGRPQPLTSGPAARLEDGLPERT